MTAPFAVETRELSHAYGDTLALDRVSLEIREGEFFALLGPNGAGKTTFVQILMTLTTPTGGRALIMGHDIAQDAAQVRRDIGVVFQETSLDDRLTAEENLEIHAALYRVPRQQRPRAVSEALSWALLDASADRAVRTFSGGMKRRLELARALMHRPRVLFLDEPTLGLDPQGRLDLWGRVMALREQGMSVLMTTHNLPEAEACDRVGVIDRGRLIRIGAPATLVAEQQGARNLEDVFLALTGRQLRDELATARDQMLEFARRGGEHTR